MTTSNEHNNAPAVPQGVPAQEVIDSIEAWKSAWLKVPPFADRVNKATREAITISHNSLFLLLQSAQQAQRMPAACPTPTGCGPHGCHGACIAATQAPAPAQEAGLTDEEIEAIAKKHMSTVGDHWCNEESIRERHAEDFARAIIAALRAKGQS